MLGTFVLWSDGIAPGQTFDTVSNQRIAPTDARSLGLELPTADGEPLPLKSTAKQ